MTQKLFTVIVVVFFSLNSWAADYEEGVHYFELPIAVGIVPDGKIEVTEYFSYGCGHCYQFDPILTAWETNLADDVEFNRTPVTIHIIISYNTYFRSSLNFISNFNF